MGDAWSGSNSAGTSSGQQTWGRSPHLTLCGDGKGPTGEKVTAGLGEETECRKNGSINAVH